MLLPQSVKFCASFSSQATCVDSRGYNFAIFDSSYHIRTVMQVQHSQKTIEKRLRSADHNQYYEKDYIRAHQSPPALGYMSSMFYEDRSERGDRPPTAKDCLQQKQLLLAHSKILPLTPLGSEGVTCFFACFHGLWKRPLSGLYIFSAFFSLCFDQFFINIEFSRQEACY